MDLKKFINKYLYLFFPVLLYLLLFNQYFFNDTYLFGFAEWYSAYSTEHLGDIFFNSLFLYSDNNWGIPAFYPVINIYHGFNLILSYILGLAFTQKLIIFSLFYFSFLGGFLLFKQFTKENKISYILALIFSFNPFLLNHLVFGHIVSVISLINLTFSGYFLLIFYENKDNKYFIISILFFAISPLNPLYIPFYLIFYFLIGLYKNISFKKNLKYMAYISIIFILLNSPWILNLIFESRASIEVISYRSGNLEGIAKQSKPIINSFLNSEYFNKDRFLNNNKFSQSLYDTSKILLWILILIFITFVRKIDNKKFYLSLLIFIIGLMLFLSGSLNPLDLSLFYLMFNLGVYQLYKEVYHFTFLLLPLVFILFAFLYGNLKKNIKKYQNIIFIVLYISLTLTIISLFEYSKFPTLSKKVYTWNNINLEDNKEFYNYICNNYKTNQYILFIPFYHTTYDLRTNLLDKEGGADSFLSSNCISSIGNWLPLNHPFKNILGIFKQDKSNREIFSNMK